MVYGNNVGNIHPTDSAKALSRSVLDILKSSRFLNKSEFSASILRNQKMVEKAALYISGDGNIVSLCFFFFFQDEEVDL